MACAARGPGDGKLLENPETLNPKPENPKALNPNRECFVSPTKVCASADNSHHTQETQALTPQLSHEVILWISCEH